MPLPFLLFTSSSCGLISSRNVLDLEMVKNAFICARSGSWPQGWWRYSHFFSMCKLGPSIYHSTPQNIKDIKKNILNFSFPKKYQPFCTLTLKCIKMTSKSSPILKLPQKDNHKMFITPKIFIFLKNS